LRFLGSGKKKGRLCLGCTIEDVFAKKERGKRAKKRKRKKAEEVTCFPFDHFGEKKETACRCRDAPGKKEQTEKGSGRRKIVESAYNFALV